MNALANIAAGAIGSTSNSLGQAIGVNPWDQLQNTYGSLGTPVLPQQQVWTGNAIPPVENPWQLLAEARLEIIRLQNKIEEIRSDMVEQILAGRRAMGLKEDA